MKKYALVTVAVFNFNGFLDTKKCLKSLLKTSYSNFEIFVIDDGSIENEIKKLKTIFNDKRITYFIDGKNRGFSFRANQAIAKSKGKYTVLLNNDTIVKRDWLLKLIEEVESDENIAVCQSKLRWMDHPEYFEYAGASGGFIDILGYPYTRGRVFFSIEKDIGQYDDVKDIFWACGAAMLIRKNIVRKIGGFDTDLFAYQEEIDFCWRVLKGGYKIKIVPSSVVYHKGMGFWTNKLSKKTFLVHRNNLVLLLRHLSVHELLWIIPLRIIFDSMSFLYYIFEKKWSYSYSLIMAYFSLIKDLPRWIKKRSKGIQPKRSPFSIVLEYYFFNKKRFSQLQGQNILKSPLLDYENLFEKQERKLHEK